MRAAIVSLWLACALMAAPVQGFGPEVPCVYFERASYALDAAARAKLDRLARMLRDNPRLELEVIGHADIEGGVEWDQELSERRARAVRRYLAARGLRITSIYAAGLGQLRPAAPSDGERNRRLNRRVELLVSGPGAAVASAVIEGPRPFL